MGEDWKMLLRWAREKSLPLQPLTPFIASALTLGAGFCTSRPLRILLLSLAIVLFLYVAADVARSMLEKERGYASYHGPPQHLPVTPFQVALAAVLAVIYSLMVLGAFKLLFLPTGHGLALIAVGVFVLSFLAAWRNVRLWWRQGADYEQALQEEAQMSRKLRIPPVH